MSVLYAVTNIAVPFALLTYQTLTLRIAATPAHYGKWILLFALTSFFNLVSLLTDSYLFILVDLGLKIGTCFLPTPINDQIEHVLINQFRLHTVVETIRWQMLTSSFSLLTVGVQRIITKLPPEEAQQLSQQLMSRLNAEPAPKPLRSAAPTTVVEVESQCTILSHDMILANRARIQRLEQENQRLQQQVEVEVKKRQKMEKRRAERTPPSRALASSTNPHSQEPTPDVISLSSSVRDLRQSQFDIEDFEEDEPKTQLKKQMKKQSRQLKQRSKVEFKPDSRPLTSRDTGLQRRNTDLGSLAESGVMRTSGRSVSPASSLKEQAQMINKLEMSVSEYSDMFSSEGEEEHGAGLKCKVEAIVEIGVAPLSRLEIYNLELYGNGELRIVSLYNREFERHQLRGMGRSSNGYYDLALTGGPVNKRRIKFRGQHQPFLKYLSDQPQH